jgi:HD-GYP domain-containing protein (c-di-GMP phosphodiesterase class II)/DNA-binding CsgD family transcriptional regulator
VQQAGQDAGVTLPELLAAHSLATDLGLGQPMEHLLRAWRIADRLAGHVGLTDEERADLFYIAVLSWVGCVADTPEVATWFGDDIAFRGDSFGVDFAGLPALTFLLRHAGAGRPALDRLGRATALVATRGRGIERGLLSHCVSASVLASRLGLGTAVSDAVRQFFTRWDGSGVPGDVAGDEISTPVRLFHLADVLEVFSRTLGMEAAVEVARARRGTKFDPALVDAFCAVAPDVLDGVVDGTDLHGLIAAVPLLQTRLTGPELDAALEALADFTDLRSVHRAGHSRAVADLAGRAAAVAGLPAAEVDAVRRAGLLHDVGLHGVPATVLDKPGPLTPTESERMRVHAYYTERVLARPAALARVGAIAALTHERLDGSGYHRGLAGAAIPAAARILAVADAYRAMAEPRSHRPALSVKQATAALREDVRAGRLAGDAVDAVLTAAGAPTPRRRTGPAGLTPREVEVLVLIARGASTRQVARRLGIAPKTAGTHVERIYVKTGATTRSTATLFAVQHGLLGSLDPLEP